MSIESRADIGLISADLVMVRNSPGTERYSGVDVVIAGRFKF